MQPILPEPHRYVAPTHLNTAKDVGVAWLINQRIRRDPRTAGHQVQLNLVEGRVRLIGTVATKDIRRAAEEIVRTTPGVKAVLNDLRIEHHGAHPKTDHDTAK